MGHRDVEEVIREDFSVADQSTLPHDVAVSIPNTFISEPVSSREEDPTEIVVKGKKSSEG